MVTKQSLTVALISTDYPPFCTSAAVQMRDLAVEMLNQGHNPVMIVPSASLKSNWKIEIMDGVTVLRLKAAHTRDVGYVRRTLAELSLSFLMIFRLYKSPFRKQIWHLVVWYSPTIFFGPFVWFLKKMTRCRTYLILRDIFPEWALELGLLKKGITYNFFKKIANIQYKVADTIGIQSSSNLSYFSNWKKSEGQNIEVLNNWQTPVPNTKSTINIQETSLAGRKIIVYIGNMGIAQGMDILIDLAESVQDMQNIGFLFVGRGSEVTHLKSMIVSRKITNTLFFNEVDSKEMPGLLEQCFIGLIALDPKHKSHNIPGKFLTYLIAGLPILARVNPGSDLQNLINNSGLGLAYAGNCLEPLQQFLNEMIENETKYQSIKKRAQSLAISMFSSDRAVRQITKI